VNGDGDLDATALIELMRVLQRIAEALETIARNTTTSTRGKRRIT
jgi:hypothetical protein